MPVTAHPHVHLNGTGRQDLVEQYNLAYTKVDEAIAALCAAAPHGRDYYLTGALSFAVADHRARLAQLQSVKDDLETLLMRLQEGA